MKNINFSLLCLHRFYGEPMCRQEFQTASYCVRQVINKWKTCWQTQKQWMKMCEQREETARRMRCAVLQRGRPNEKIRHFPFDNFPSIILILFTAFYSAMVLQLLRVKRFGHNYLMNSQSTKTKSNSRPTEINVFCQSSFFIMKFEEKNLKKEK